MYVSPASYPDNEDATYRNNKVFRSPSIIFQTSTGDEKHNFDLSDEYETDEKEKKSPPLLRSISFYIATLIFGKGKNVRRLLFSHFSFLSSQILISVVLFLQIKTILGLDKPRVLDKCVVGRAFKVSISLHLICTRFPFWL